MASRLKGYGLTAELANKVSSEYDTELAQQAMAWIQDVTGEQIASITDSSAVQEKLKDGVILCKTMNTLDPGCVTKVNESKMTFKQMENIGKFLEATYAYGVPKSDMFQTVDLYEGQNMAQVINAIHALGRKAAVKGYSGPTLGPKEAQANKREFTDEQMNAGQGVIGLQMGANKGASQAGQNFGKTRQILEYL